HAVTMVVDLIIMSDRIHTPRPNDPHLPIPVCACRDCALDRLEGCLNPHQCAQEALTRIHLIGPKMNPLSPGLLHGNFSLTPGQKATNTAAKETNAKILFDPSVTCKNNLAECFRIFTNANKISNLPATRNYIRRFNIQYREVPVCTDEACHNNRKLNACCGSGIWFAPNDPSNSATRIPGRHQSNQIGKVTAIIQAVSATPPFHPLKIFSDLKYTIAGLTKHLNTWEDIGWIGIKNAAFFKRAAYLLKSRTATTHFKWVKGHNGDHGNEESNRLAKEGADK
ncbi:Ribonuclease H-like domain containing protein, partial [Russula decolorans]